MVEQKSTAARNHRSISDFAQRVVPWICAILLWLGTFALYYSLTIRFDRLHVFEQPNILFHADPMWRIESLSSGYGWADRNLVHPNLGNYFSIPNRVVSLLCTRVGIYQGSESELRRDLALLIVPTLSALSVSILFVLMYRAGLHVAQSLLVAAMGAFSFSQLIFGSIPDHFAISGFCLVAGYWLAIEFVRSEKIYWIGWIVVGILATGITITNVVWLGALFSLPQLFRSPWQLIVKNSVIWLIAVLSVTFCVAELGNLVYEQNRRSWAFPESNRYQRDFSDEGIWKLSKAPAVLANTLSPPQIETVPNRQAYGSGRSRDYMFSLEKTSSGFANLLIILMLMTGAAGWLRERGQLGMVALASLLILGTNLVMHAIWSVQYVVFSQHWLMPTIFLLAGNFRLSTGYRVVASIGLISMATFMVWNNMLLLQEILSTLANHTISDPLPS